MKVWYSVLFLGLINFGFSQSLANLKADSMCYDSISISNDSISLLYDSIPEIVFFNPNTIENHTSKIATYQIKKKTSKLTQSFILLLFFAWFVTWYKDLFKASFKSLYDFNYCHQYLRSKKNSNFIPLVLISGVFILFSALFIKNNILSNQSIWYILLWIVILVVYDIISNYIFLFFANSNVLQLTQNSYLGFHVVMLTVLVALYLIVNVETKYIQKIVEYIYILSILVLSILRLVRVQYLLTTEKAKVFSLHFFIYLCTFKIMPFIVLISIFLKK